MRSNHQWLFVKGLLITIDFLLRTSWLHRVFSLAGVLIIIVLLSLWGVLIITVLILKGLLIATFKSPDYSFASLSLLKRSEQVMAAWDLFRW